MLKYTTWFLQRKHIRTKPRWLWDWRLFLRARWTRAKFPAGWDENLNWWEKVNSELLNRRTGETFLKDQHAVTFFTSLYKFLSNIGPEPDISEYIEWLAVKKFQTLLELFHADVWEVEETIRYVQSLSRPLKDSLRHILQREQEPLSTKTWRDRASSQTTRKDCAFEGFQGLSAAITFGDNHWSQ